MCLSERFDWPEKMFIHRLSILQFELSHNKGIGDSFYECVDFLVSKTIQFSLSGALTKVKCEVKWWLKESKGASIQTIRLQLGF